MPGYEVKFEDVAIAGGADIKLRSLLDLQQYSDPLGEAEAAGISSATWPLFGLLWPSAQKLADLMQVWEIGTQRILELGCGLGLASLVLHRRQGNITATDYHPLAAAFMNANLQLNQMGGMKFQRADWAGENHALGEFDLIIGSDVLYERAHPAMLAAFIVLHAAPSASVLLIDPNRSNRTAFNQAMLAAGFSLQETAINTPLHDGSAYRGRLLHYQRTADASLS